MTARCLYCSAEFQAKLVTARYCSAKCRVYWHRYGKGPGPGPDWRARKCPKCGGLPYLDTDRVGCMNCGATLEYLQTDRRLRLPVTG